MQKGALAIFQCFKTTKKLPISDWYHEFLESPSDKLQIRTTLGWSLELVHLSGSGPWTKALKDEQMECIHRIVCHGRDVLAVLPTGLGKSATYQLISKVLFRISSYGPYSQRHIKNHRRTPCFAYKVERYLHQGLLLKPTHYERDRITCFTK